MIVYTRFVNRAAFKDLLLKERRSDQPRRLSQAEHNSLIDFWSSISDDIQPIVLKWLMENRKLVKYEKQMTENREEGSSESEHLKNWDTARKSLLKLQNVYKQRRSASPDRQSILPVQDTQQGNSPPARRSSLRGAAVSGKQPEVVLPTAYISDHLTTYISDFLRRVLPQELVTSVVDVIRAYYQSSKIPKKDLEAEINNLIDQTGGLKLNQEQFNRYFEALRQLNLPRFTRLNLSRLIVTDLKPLSHLAGQLKELNLSDTKGLQNEDFAVLSTLKELTTLSLTRTAIFDLSPLGSLKHLKHLFLTTTPITDLKPISSVTSLKTLGLTGTRVTDLTPLIGMKSLTSLKLLKTWVTSLKPLAGLTGLLGVHLSDSQLEYIKVPTSLIGVINEVEEASLPNGWLSRAP